MKKVRDQQQLKIYRAKRCAHVKKWRVNTKRKIVEILGGECRVCGYNKCLWALAAHHVDPDTKEFGLSKIMVHPIAWERIVPEIKKCILLCANCHAEAHAGQLDISAYELIYKECIPG